MKQEKLIIFCDGGAYNNPGPAGIGIVFYNEKGEKLYEFSKFLGNATNNQAEYQAVICALEIAKEKFDADFLQFFIDSKLVVEQLNGNYKLKNQGLKPLYYLVKKWQMNFPIVIFNHILRDKNELADALVKKVINKNLHER